MPDPQSSARNVEPSLQEILDALNTASEPAESGLRIACPNCITVNASVVRTLKSHFYEFVNDPESRVRLRESRGYCREHAALLPRTGDALGTAIIYADLTDLAIEQLKAAPPKPGIFSRKTIAKKLAPCTACIQEAEASLRYAQALAAGLGAPEVWEALEAGSGLCTGHLQQTLAAADPRLAAKLRAHEIKKLESLKAELYEAIRKSDYRFRHEPIGDEKDAWLRAPGKVVREQPST